jgi:hypothetical protein
LPHDPHFDVSSGSALARAQRSPEAARIEVERSSTGSSDASVVVSQDHRAERVDADRLIVPAKSPDSSKSERMSAVWRRAPSVKTTRGVRRQRTSETGPNVVEFAPNPSPSQALHDFMARPSSQ